MDLRDLQEWVREQYTTGEYRGMEDQFVSFLVSQVGLLGDATKRGNMDALEERIAGVVFLTLAVADRHDIDVEEALRKNYSVEGV